MSDHSEAVYSTAEGMDYPEHERTYKAFIKLGTIFAGTAATIVVLLGFSLSDHLIVIFRFKTHNAAQRSMFAAGVAF